MAMNVTPFQSTDEFTMAGFNGKISDINSGVNTEITSALSGFARIETGSYVGTGTYGASNPNTLTFGFVPRLVMVSPTASGFTDNTLSKPFLWFEGITSVLDKANGFNNNVTREGNTISWYTNASYPLNQFNISGTTYYYIAIG